MSHEDIKAAFADAVSHVVSNISQYTTSPVRDFTRSRKMGADRLISFLVSCGSSGTRIELLDFFGLQAHHPPLPLTSSAPNSDRKHWKPSSTVSTQPSRPVQDQASVSLPRMARPSPFSAGFPLLPRNTLYQKDIPRKASTACT